MERPPKDALEAMHKIAAAIAKMAIDESDKFRNVPGDVALRLFAKSIQKTNASMFTDA